MKYPNFYFLAIAIALFSAGCKKDNVENDLLLGGVTMEQSVDIRVTSSKGEDLLDPANKNKITDFKVYHGTDKENVLFNQPNLDAPSGYSIKKNEKENYYYLQVLLTTPYSQEPSAKTTTYLKIGSYELDTIQASYFSTTPSIKLSKVWFNNNITWDATSNTQMLFEIVKP
ncbi:hypothetical protein [Dyadobacter frigoris]|uniref:Uncharacterized protein n=1 Tax=Dyadobacter frigoris TaxID=2576211 RepID=A0A4U6D820_9BACT|nr:hypothetical protein [Dyadobacter frigoris]TKT92461.1 hypothetical protein FDK13_10865 [Dyadobacter frigoris]GLU55247.1 hypothetical protein Dfri01_47080 [Dyadobacter frigoris]